MHTDWSSLSSFNCDDFGSHLTETNLNKLEYFIRPIKKTFFVNCWPSWKYVNLLYMYSKLGRGSFCFNYCLNSAWHGGDQFVALLRWYGSPGFFDRGLQLICIFWSLVSRFSLDNTWWVLVSLFASQAHQHHGHLTNFWCFWQCGQVPNPDGKWNQHL